MVRNGVTQLCMKFDEDQARAEVPFDPTAGEDMTDEEKKKLLEHCVYLWDVKTLDAWFASHGMKPPGLTGIQLLNPKRQPDYAIRDEDGPKFVQKYEEEGHSVKFQQALLNHVNR